ncbi:MAG: exo-alpha-sialidase [Gemmatimonadaceae bacterium]|nr:exo-alpha-sialidase [Gemmatimonadaceae bacterium]
MRRARLAGSLLVSALAVACARVVPRAPAARITPILGDWPSDGAPPPSVHASTMAEVNSTLTAAWFAGAYESAKDVGIWFTRYERGRWTPPVEIATGGQAGGERFPTWNPVLDAPGGHRLVLYYKVGPNPREWWGMVRESADGGRTWGAPRRLPDGLLGPIKNKLVRLRDGTLVSPSSTEAPDAANAWRVHFERSTDGGRTWTQVLPAPSAREVDAIQPTVLVHRDGALQALVRTRGPGVLYETWSRDAGRTWSALAPTALPNPNSGIDAVTLRDGRQLLVSNPVRDGRTPLVVSLSRDGVTWTPIDTLESAPGEYSYPAVIQTRDGLVHVSYTWQRRRVKHVVLRVH